jgi:hypothetical protein
LPHALHIGGFEFGQDAARSEEPRRSRAAEPSARLNCERLDFVPCRQLPSSEHRGLKRRTPKAAAF